MSLLFDGFLKINKLPKKSIHHGNRFRLELSFYGLSPANTFSRIDIFHPAMRRLFLRPTLTVSSFESQI